MSASARLAEKGITLPEVATPVGTYVPARLDGSRVYTSGQLPMVDGVLSATGHIGSGHDHVSPELAAECATTAALNAVAAAAHAAGGVDRLHGVISITAYLATTPDFGDHPAILNPASALMGEIFGDQGRHARAVVGVSSLPLGAPVEVAAIFAITPD